MKLGDFEIEARLAEAVSAAAGRLRRSPGEGQDGESRSNTGQVQREAESLTGALWGIVSRLDGLTASGARSGASSWADAVGGLNPVLGGLLRLFGGSGEEDAAVLPPVVKPTKARYEAGYTRGQEELQLVDRDAWGAVRPAGTIGAPSVVVHVDAIDSRSFLERAPEIAEAMRKALLESEEIRAVLSEWQD